MQVEDIEDAVALVYKAGGISREIRYNKQTAGYQDKARRQRGMKAGF